MTLIDKIVAIHTALEAEHLRHGWWDDTPVDIFLNTTTYHDGVADRCRHEWFGGLQLPFLSCSDLAVFKAFFNRSKDWVDLEEMAAAGPLDVDVETRARSGPATKEA